MNQNVTDKNQTDRQTRRAKLKKSSDV